MSDRTKPQTEVHRTSTDLDNAKATEITTQAEVNRAQSAVNAAEAQIDAASSAHASILAQESKTNPADEPALRRLAAERSFLESKRRALEGRRDQLRAVSEKARTDLDTARVTLSQVQREHDTAQERYQRAEEAHREAELVAAGDPGALRRKAASDRAEAILNEHARIVRSHGVFSPGAGPCEATIDSEAARERLSNKEAFAPGEHGWGVSSFERGRYSSPVGARGTQEQTQVEGSKPYDNQNPLNND